MRQIDHFISGGSGGPATRFGDIMDPNNGVVQARVALGDAAVLERAVQAALVSISPAAAATKFRQAGQLRLWARAATGAMQSAPMPSTKITAV